MDFTQLQIAKLVLGYLKKEKCQEALSAFCDASPHLKHFSEMIKNRKKFFITRVNGLSLVDYLTEYAVIYTLVQERLEDTDYFEEKRSKNLVDELRYLLEKGGRQNRENTPSQSRSSTPMREQHHKEHERLHFPKNLSIIAEASHCDATPLRSLPGNSSDDSPNKAQKRAKSSSSSRKSDEIVETDSEDSPDKSFEEDDMSLQVLTQTLLEHHELHEKIAENINLFRSTTETVPVASAEERIPSGVLQELDSAIKAIVQKTEADPIFEKLISEIIGSVGETTTDEEQTDGHKNSENTKSVQVRESGLATPVLQFEENSVKQRLRSSDKQSSERRTNDDQEENVALRSATAENPHSVRSISSVEVNENVPISDAATVVNVQKNLSVNTTTGDIIFYDGTLDNFMKTSTAGVSQPSSSLVYNNGLLMVQPTAPALMPAVNTLQVNPTKPCYMWNGSQLLNVSVPQLKVNNLTEQDILTMPTVIVCDDNNQQGILNNLVVPAGTSQELTAPQNKFVNIAPRVDKTADRAESIGEFLTLYQCNDSNDTGPPQKVQDLKPKVKTKKKIRKGVQKSTALSTIRIEVLAPAAAAAAEDSVTSELKVETENHLSTSPGHESNAAEADVNASQTPELVKRTSERHRNLSTPKSGSRSHVRALDFNFGTPGKLGKDNASSKSSKKTPRKSPTAKISKSLFGTPTKTQKTADDVDKKEDVPDETATVKVEIGKASNSWDSHLRALAGPMPDRCPTPKRKRKDNFRSKKGVKKTKIEGNSSTESVEKNGGGPKKSKRKSKVAATPNKITKSKILPSTTTEKPEVKAEEDIAKPVEITEAPAEANCTKDCETSDVPSVSEMPFSLINCNAKARYKRKCNIDNNLKKEVKITKVKEIKSLEFINDGSNKLILSPSKLNANKRSLVEIDEKETKLQCTTEHETKTLVNDMVVLEQTTITEEKSLQSDKKDTKLQCTSEHESKTLVVLEQTITEEKSLKSDKSTTELINPTSSGETSSKFITPEMQKDTSFQHPVISKRNITPMLETPMKMVMSQCPKTPGILSPISNTDTPFTKVFKEQLHGVDISCIQTPKFPLTPNFPFTPTTPYPVRPSDYSTSSSYYQPSDTEQNKSLEQLMIAECNRLENRKDTPVKIMKEEEEEGERPAVPVTKDSELKNPAENVAREVSESERDLTNKAIVEKMKALSSNVIARKNLSLMDKANVQAEDASSCTTSSSSDSTSSDEVSETSNSESDSDDDMWNSSKNETVVQKTKSEMTKSSRYNLRSRRGDAPKAQKKILDVTAEDIKSTEMIQQIIAELEIKPTLETNAGTSALSNHQEKVLQEMEQKRQRMIARLKDDQNIKSKETAVATKQKKLKDDEKTTKAIRKHALRPRMVKGGFVKTADGLKDTSKPAVKKPVSRRKSNLPKKILSNVNGTNAPLNSQGILRKEVEGVKLHLTSDSECTKLEPFDLVETELGESSTSPRPLPLVKIPETHPLKSFHLALETITTNQNGKNKQTNSDQEAESLVKGLKEWGIHLIHNKSPKKHDNRVTVNEKERKSEVTSKIENSSQNYARESSLQARGNSDEIVQANDKKDELRKSDDQISTVKNKNMNCKVNESLEEGEILSEGECVNTEVKKPKPNYSSSRRGPQKAERRPTKQYMSAPLPRKSYSSGSSKSRLGKASASSKSKAKSKTSITSRAKTKEETPPQKGASAEKIPPEIVSVNKMLNDLNLTNSTSELTFDVKFFPEEDLRLLHDESRTCPNTEISRYDSDLLNKKVSARVYLESIDAEIEKFMTVTPLDFILDIPDGFSYKSGEPKVKILECVTLHAKKDLSTISPLDNLYEPETSTRYDTKTLKYKKTVLTSLSIRRKSVEQKRLPSTAAARQSRSKSVDQKMLLSGGALTFSVAEKKKSVVNKQTDKGKVKSADREKKAASQTKQKKSTASSTKANKKENVDVKNSLNCNSDCKVSTSSEDKKIETPGDSEQTSKDTRKLVEITEVITDNNVTTPEKINDDLMNYAICGSERTENVEESTKKQKSNETVDSDKLQNCQELLSKINVDVFLSKLHGE